MRRPIPAGASVGVKEPVSACCIVQGKNGERFLLTLHLRAGVGSRVTQPAAADGQGLAIGRVARVGAHRERSAVLVRLEPGVEFDLSIPNSGPIKGVARKVRPGDQLRAVGRGSGFTTGHVLAIRSRDIITTMEYAPGDEGAPVVNVRNELVGVLYTGQDKISAVLPIGPLLKELDVTFASTP